MARNITASGQEEQTQEPDRYMGTPHPRKQLDFIGHNEAEQEILSAIHQERLHHAWLICGIEGIGKATLAYRIARFLLQEDQSQLQQAQSLQVAEGSFVTKQIEALSHPNLVVLRRSITPDNKISSIINVDSVRKAMSLFETMAVGGRYRICIVDSADDLNNASANALLKLLEEPPQRSLFLLISHAPQRLLPTIRSRCRTLHLRPLDDQHIRNIIQTLGEQWINSDSEKLGIAIRNGEGSVKRTLEMLHADNLMIIKMVEALLSSLPKKNDKDVLALADLLSRKNSENLLDLALDIIQRWVSTRLLDLSKTMNEPHSQMARFMPLIEAMEKMTRDVQTASVYNLDRRPLILNFFDELSQAVQ